jgi:hypothetical protein
MISALFVIAQLKYGLCIIFRSDEAIVKTPDALRRGALLTTMLAAGLVTFGCTPTVKVEAPKEPITINLNIKLDADVRVKLEQQAKDDVATKPIF